MLNLSGIDAINGPAHKPDEYYIRPCPFCGDDRYKVGINTRKGIYHCFVCEAKGSLKDVKELAILGDYKEKSSLDDLRNRLNRTSDPIQETTYDLQEFSWPIDRVETPIAFNYMLGRGYSPRELDEYSIRVGRPYWDSELGYEVKKWSGRIIFPFFDEDKNCTYLVGRSYNGGKPKYKNCSSTKALVVYGIDRVMGDRAILCEGIISAHAAERITGLPAVAVLGKHPLETQIMKLKSKCKIIYKSFDGDVDETKNRQVNKSLYKAGFQTWEVILPPEEDPDSLGKDYLKYFEKAKKLTLF